MAREKFRGKVATLSSSLLASLDVHLLVEDAAVVAVPTPALRSHSSAAVGASRPQEIFDRGWLDRLAELTACTTRLLRIISQLDPARPSQL